MSNHFRLSDAVTVLVELTYYVTYETLGCDASDTDPPPLIDKYSTSYAGLEIKLSCIQLKVFTHFTTVKSAYKEPAYKEFPVIRN